MQHAHMSLWVVAEAPADFERWMQQQLQPASAPAEANLARGQQVFLANGCILCHTIAGTPAAGQVAPDLSHFGSRISIAAGTLNNKTISGALVGVAQGVKRGEGIAVPLRKAGVFPPLAAHLGCLAVGVGLYAGRAVGVGRRWLVVAAVLWVVGVALIAVLPHEATVLVRGKAGQEKLTLAATVWRVSGTAVLLCGAGCAGVLLFSAGRGLRTGRRADSLFVVGWVLIELAGYFVLTPFPAARRVVGLSVALGVLAARTVSRVSRARPDRRPPRWVIPFGVFFIRRNCRADITVTPTAFGSVVHVRGKLDTRAASRLRALRAG